MTIASKLLWIDCLAGAGMGAVVLLLHPVLSGLYGIPVEVVLFMGLVNLVYAAYSFSLAALVRPRMATLVLLVFANLAWAATCVGVMAGFAATATSFGMGLLAAEAVFVSGLAFLEWRYRKEIAPVGYSSSAQQH